MAKLNIEHTRKALQSFDFKKLFIEELGWSNPSSNKAINETIKEIAISRKPIAELSGAVVFEITTPTGEVPEPTQRLAIAKEIQKQHFEHVLIFIDSDRKQSIWHWLKNQDKKVVSREHFFFRHQPGDGFIAKIASLVVDISEFDREGNIAIAEVATRIKSALDIERVVKKFFRDYQNEYIVFLDLIEGIDNEADRRWYASVILNRLMFIYFLQKKMFLDNGDTEYLNHKLEFSKKDLGKNKFYNEFLSKLFFEGFAKPKDNRGRNADERKKINDLIGEIRYLNGGLFLLHKIEVKYQGRIKIPDQAFDNLFDLFNRYSWTLDDTPGGTDNEMNPDVLGYIFEKYINQKAFGAYYTRTEITEYLCEQTVYKLILDAVNEPEIDADILKIAGAEKYKAKRYDSIAELLLHLDAKTCKKLIVGEEAIIPNLSLLDPACGSGAFLVAAMKTLINVYAAILGKIEFFGDKKLTEWKQQIEKDHPSINYYIKKQIITNNLYGVDLMEEATEIAKLRLFLALVASAETVEQLEPLPNIDFNIMSGNSLIGMMRVDPNRFNKHIPQQTPKGKIVSNATLFQPGLIQGNIFAEGHSKSYKQLINEKEAAIRSFRNAYELGITDIEGLKKTIDESEQKANEILDNLLVEEFTNLGIIYEQVTWDNKKNKVGKSIKRSINLKDIQSLEPFHWGYEFSEIFRKKDGFDAIITNPPWEVFKPNSKEFFLDYSKVVSKKKMNIKDFEKEQEILLQDDEIRAAWTDYLSRFPHVSSYYRIATQYKNQISVVNGKKAGSDINLYKLFTEQCYNLLRKGGYCGIVIPSAIYTGLGTMQLRKMLFEDTQISNLISLSNEKFIFENVHHAFKFCFLSFEKGKKTKKFNAIFRIDPREAIHPRDLEYLFDAGDDYIELSPELIAKLSPDALSVMEFHGEIDKKIIDKMVMFSPLGEISENEWNLKIGSEFHMTGDSHLFKTKPSKNSLPLYEGKMINQFEHYTSLAKYWVDEKAGRQAIIGKRKDDDGEFLPYQDYRLGFRAVAGNTNSRTIIVGPIPRNVFCGNSLLVSQDLVGANLVVAQALLNSFIVDFYARQMITNNVNMFYIYQLPVPRLKSKDKWFTAIVERAARLICTTEEFAQLWEEVMKTTWSEKEAATQEYERSKLRAELDGIIAHIYGLSEEEFAYILSAFPVVPQPQKVATQNAYRDVERELIKPN
ncbi:Eco57I restriction-modification methylase domain-containing protein [Aquiflexum sp. TKW24L]|uniref:Eco57I restriction-modification methylase domain-containing protein n=1 Tax=Aquiflexum sp. TKW24L TaxID=2942212 RepID=UPI0020BF92CE|nr:DNA methyltransferase [Aquiflexum sp. TKW24L]MCL6259284.1 Eco57I restriction-modification methylase domain-containing protein [Aquiflexum sp. TKW24L]